MSPSTACKKPGDPPGNLRFLPAALASSQGFCKMMMTEIQPSGGDERFRGAKSRGQRLWHIRSLGLIDGIHQIFQELPIGWTVGKVTVQSTAIICDANSAAH